MIYLVVGIPLLFLGTFTRVYDLTAETCFWVDGLSRSANCFSKGSVVPHLFKWVPQMAGAALILWGIRLSRAARRVKDNQPPS